ncbi:MAG: lecithin-cholesterol acyltransferase [Parcubacteria bacterium C7867-001]|nr:MAG: lecithin-cholesterol acyltransferase [Parcubacteria bacterium C7867-001]
MPRFQVAGHIGLLLLALGALPFPVFADTASSTVVYEFPHAVWGSPNGAFVGGGLLYSEISSTTPGGIWMDVAKDFDHWYDADHSYTFDTFEVYLTVGGFPNISAHPLTAGTVAVKIYAADESWVTGELVAASAPIPASTLFEAQNGDFCNGDGSAASPFSAPCIASFSFPSGTVLAAGQHYVFEINGNGIVSETDLHGETYYYPGLSMVGASVSQYPFGNDGIQDAPNVNTGAVYLRLSTDAPPIPVCTENCNDNVLFLPGIEGSALKEGNDSLWPPSIWSHDVSRLALDENGNSVNDITVAGALSDFYGANLYGGFASFMDDLATTSVIREWKPLAYDWRFSPERILSDGIKTQNGIVDPVATFEALAANSKTGKVTIVAHSMGGLLGKTLIKKLQGEGKDGLIGSFVMIGTPQLGTPQAIPSLLHGEQPLALEFFVRSPATRSVAQNMQSTYDLLPSKMYFDSVQSPPISFDENASYTQAWRDLWVSIDAYDEFTEFLTGTGVTRTPPQPTDLGTPEVLDPVLLARSTQLHEGLDSYSIPSHIRVVQVAGWGLTTTKAITYWNAHVFGIPTPIRSYKIVPTVEGDQTVVYPSALSSTGEKYFFDLSLFNGNQAGHDFDHKDLLNTGPVQEVIGSVLKRESVTTTTYILDQRPDVSEIDEQLLIITRSPILIGAYDSEGNFTGIDQNQDLTSEILFISKNIPGSNFLVSGENQYLFLPKGVNYTLKFKGTDTGQASIETATFVNDEIHPFSGFTDMPVTPSVSATFSIDGTTLVNTELEVDQNGDGQVDTYIPSDGSNLSIEHVLSNLKNAVQNLNASAKVKTQLQNKIANVETKIAKQKQKQTNSLSKIKMQLEKKAEKGRIDASTANTLIALLDELLAQSSIVPFDPALILELKGQINSANISLSLKSSLLAKLGKLESVAGIGKSIDTMAKAVRAKSAKGALVEAETQNLLNLLDQLQGAI